MPVARAPPESEEHRCFELITTLGHIVFFYLFLFEISSCKCCSIFPFFFVFISPILVFSTFCFSFLFSLNCFVFIIYYFLISLFFILNIIYNQMFHDVDPLFAIFIFHNLSCIINVYLDLKDACGHLDLSEFKCKISELLVVLSSFHN